MTGKERQEAINAGNILIANFMGYKYYPHPDEHGLPGWKKSNRHMPVKLMSRGEIGGAFYIGRVTKDLMFHSNWGWLMPALEKAEKLGYPYLLSKETCTIYKKWMLTWAAHEHGKTTKEAAWLCLTEFIIYYNTKENETISKSSEGDKGKGNTKTTS